MNKLSAIQIREREIKKVAYLLAWKKAVAATKAKINRIKSKALI